MDYLESLTLQMESQKYFSREENSFKKRKCSLDSCNMQAKPHISNAEDSER